MLQLQVIILAALENAHHITYETYAPPTSDVTGRMAACTGDVVPGWGHQEGQVGPGER